MRGTKRLCVALLAGSVAVLTAPAASANKKVVVAPVRPGSAATILTLSNNRPYTAYADITLPHAFNVAPMSYAAPASHQTGWSATGCGDKLYGFYLRPVGAAREAGVGAVVIGELWSGAGVENPYTSKPGTGGGGPSALPIPLGVEGFSHFDEAPHQVYLPKGDYRAYVIVDPTPAAGTKKTRRTCAIRIPLTSQEPSPGPMRGTATHPATVQWDVAPIGAGEPGVPQPRAGVTTFDLAVTRSTLVFTMIQWVFYKTPAPGSTEVYSECVERNTDPVCRPDLPVTAPGYTPAVQGGEFWRTMISTEAGPAPVGRKDITQCGEWYIPGKLATGPNTVKLTAISTSTPMLIQGAMFAIDL